MGPSISCVNTEYSVWTTATAAILTARRSVADETNDRPICFILPSLGTLISMYKYCKKLSTYAFSSARARIVSSIGVSELTLCG